MTDPRVTHRLVNEHGELVEMKMPPDVFADVVRWHQPRGWYGPVTVTSNDEARRQLRARLAEIDQRLDELNGS
jgi:hypothetical protein